MCREKGNTEKVMGQFPNPNSASSGTHVYIDPYSSSKNWTGPTAGCDVSRRARRGAPLLPFHPYISVLPWEEATAMGCNKATRQHVRAWIGHVAAGVSS